MTAFKEADAFEYWILDQLDDLSFESMDEACVHLQKAGIDLIPGGQNRLFVTLSSGDSLILDFVLRNGMVCLCSISPY